MVFLLCKTDFTGQESNAVERQTKTIEALVWLGPFFHKHGDEARSFEILFFASLQNRLAAAWLRITWLVTLSGAKSLRNIIEEDVAAMIDHYTKRLRR
jgi:hypothetical protein